MAGCSNPGGQLTSDVQHHCVLQLTEHCGTAHRVDRAALEGPDGQPLRDRCIHQSAVIAGEVRSHVLQAQLLKRRAVLGHYLAGQRLKSGIQNSGIFALEQSDAAYFVGFGYVEFVTCAQPAYLQIESFKKTIQVVVSSSAIEW